MSNKRVSTQPPAPKPPTQLDPSLIISEQASLTGTKLITMGSNTVIHPRCKLNSINGPITIGNSCILSERCRIGLQSEPHQVEANSIVIGDGVVIETGAIVEASIIGDGSVIEVNSKIGKGAILGKVRYNILMERIKAYNPSQYCKVGPYCEVADREVVPDYTVIYGRGQRRLDNSGIDAIKMKMLGKQIEALKKLIPSSLAYFQ
ncbi:Dynactin subunit 6 [Golovinomyces cichoracearum]|uniref:Dynactin subunit 6 n=1 Tax=Golovinomyces cichoracearum TaxID=62708 RepID=A0A420I8X0_9PEZI|nr:Dynactin subunit 6 [Golovinomyces cichoracearum]